MTLFLEQANNLSLKDKTAKATSVFFFLKNQKNRIFTIFNPSSTAFIHAHQKII